MFYVTMTDTFVTRMILNDDRVSKYIVECETLEQAQQIKKNALTMQEMKYINILDLRPKYNLLKYSPCYVRYIDVSSRFKKIIK